MNRILYICAIMFLAGSVCIPTVFMAHSQKFGQAADSLMETSKENQSARNSDNIEDGSYLKKTWITDGASDHGGKIFPLSLIITQISNGIVEGHIAFDEMVQYNYDGTWRDIYPAFCGTIHKGKAYCRYIDKEGNLSSLELTFCDEHWIQAMLDGDENQSYQLRPYNVADNYYINEPTRVEVELSGWGTATLFYANDLSNHTTPDIMLINEEGDVLYNFEGKLGYQSGTEVLDVIVRDMNRDGMDDVEIITCGFDGIGSEKWCAEWYYYQREDGMFIYDETDFVSANNEKDR